MKLSIIVPVYNEKEAVVQCLDAILSQDYGLRITILKKGEGIANPV